MAGIKGDSHIAETACLLKISCTMICLLQLPDTDLSSLGMVPQKLPDGFPDSKCQVPPETFASVPQYIFILIIFSVRTAGDHYSDTSHTDCMVNMSFALIHAFFSVLPHLLTIYRYRLSLYGSPPQIHLCPDRYPSSILRMVFSVFFGTFKIYLLHNLNKFLFFLSSQ